MHVKPGSLGKDKSLTHLLVRIPHLATLCWHNFERNAMVWESGIWESGISLVY